MFHAIHHLKKLQHMLHGAHMWNSINELKIEDYAKEKKRYKDMCLKLYCFRCLIQKFLLATPQFWQALWEQNGTF